MIGSWFGEHAVAQSLFVLSVVIASGLVIGSLRVAGIRLGVAGVLFAGILAAHSGLKIDHATMEFARELGLILFVYTIGIQVGPGFLSSLKREGLALNLLAAFVVLSGAAITVGLVFLAGVPFEVAVGMFSGATTNTPSLAAAQQALKETAGYTQEIAQMPGIGYALAYPFGVLGIILTMLFTRFLLKIHPPSEVAAYQAAHDRSTPPLEARSLRVDNPNLDGKPLSVISDFRSSPVTFSRILQGGKVQVALPDTRMHTGDVLLAVGSGAELDKIQIVVGSRSATDIRQIKSEVTSRRLIVTRSDLTGKPLSQIDPVHRYGVTVTRIIRSEVELAADGDAEMHLGDTIVVVGEEDSIRKFAADTGDEPKQLAEPHLVPIFLGIALGVALGSLAIRLPGMPAPFKLGLAGGPLLVAVFLSARRKIGSLVWFMPRSANFMLRELGISMFLACVGLRAGEKFFETVFSSQGLYWMACAALITLIPILVMAFFARLRLKMNYLTLCGVLAGSMTDPPALAFSNQMAPSNAQMVAYASVYPLVMLMRILIAQALVMFLASGWRGF